MRVTAETIWAVPGHLPSRQPPLTDEAVVAAEKEIGHKLPGEYLELLRKQNGGTIRFSLPGMVHNSIAGIGPHFRSLTGIDWDDYQDCVSFPLLGLVPFDGDGHWFLCLDYRKNLLVPTITHADVECDDEEHIADSFADYLAMLRFEVEDKYVLEGVTDIEGLKADLARQLGVQFDPPNTWDNAYRIERVRLGDDADPQWLWISPNTVCRGFVSKDHHRYPELKDLMLELGDQFPGLPANSYFLEVTDRVRARVLDACTRSGLTMRPLREYVADI